MVNIVTLIGRLGSDPELKVFDSGSMKSQVSLAVKDISKRDNPPFWFNLELWGKTAEIACNYAKKGSLIAVKGSLKIETWADKTTGNSRSRPVIVVNQLELLSSKNDIQTPPSPLDGF